MMTDQSGPSRFWQSYATVAGVGSAVFVLLVAGHLRAGGDALLVIAGLVTGLIATLVLHRLLLNYWRRLNRHWIRALACGMASWLVMAIVIVTQMAVAGDPFQAQRVADEGWLAWLLGDIVLRGFLFAVAIGAPFILIWGPVAGVWYLAIRKVAYRRVSFQ
jgi:hypothetical protein